MAKEMTKRTWAVTMCMQVCRAATRRTTYRPLYQVVREYLGCHKDIWNNYSDLITIVGSCMKIKARDRFDSRAQRLESIKVADKLKLCRGHAAKKQQTGRDTRPSGENKSKGATPRFTKDQMGEAFMSEIGRAHV